MANRNDTIPDHLRGTTRAPNGMVYEADSMEDAFFISRGRADLVPGARCVGRNDNPPQPPLFSGPQWDAFFGRNR